VCVCSSQEEKKKEKKMGGASADLHHHESDIELTDAERSETNNNAGGSESKHGTDVELDSGRKSEAEAGEGHYVEVTMDIHGDSVALHSVKDFDGVEEEDEKLGLTGKRLEKKKSFGASVVQSAAIRMKQLKRLASFSKPAPKHFERTKSAVAHALTGLKFISMTDGGAGWDEVENRFQKLTANSDGYLPRTLFAQCLGTPNLLVLLQVT